MNMKTIEGVVMRSHEKVVSTAKGPSSVYSVLLNTGSAEEWFSFGFKKPAVTNNQQVKFTVKQNGNYWNGDPDSIETIKTGEAAAPATMKKAVASVDEKQRSIVFQSAYERAILMINGAITLDLISLPAKKAAKFDAYCELVHERALILAEMFISPPSNFAETGLPDDVNDVSDPPKGGDDDYNVV